MFSSYQPNVKATILYLKELKVKVNSGTVNDTLQNHPDWPSMLCISDSLNKWNITNGVGKIDPVCIDQLPIPFIAFTNDRKAPLSIVTRVSATSIEICQNNYAKPATETREDFLKKWGGVYLIAEPTEHSGELNYELNKRNSFFISLIPVAAIAALAVLSFVLLYNTVSTNTSMLSVTTGIYFQYLILLAGVVVSILLLWYTIDKNNPLLQKVCTGIAKGNCNAILSGKQSKVFSWLSWSEVGFFYFAGGMLTLLSSANNLAGSIALIGWLNILALPYTVFSIYYQSSVAKQWCVLCLAVQALFIAGGTNVVLNNFLFPFPALSLPFLVHVIMMYLLPVLSWFAVKPYILTLQEAKNTKREYLRLKFNGEIFETLLKKQKQVTISTNGLGIDLGNHAATNTLIKVCSPYCGPCAKAHSKIEALLEHNDNVKVKIIFTTSNNEEQHAIKPTRHLMAIAGEICNEKITKQSLNDWYLAETKDYELLAKKYPMNGELLKQGHKIEAMDKWCKAMDIKVTPTIFINGYQLPNAYSIEDLQYFLLE